MALTNFQGLTSEEAEKLLAVNGLNELQEGKKTIILEIFARQFANFIIYVLLAAAVISLVVGEVVNFAVITTIIFFIIGLGFVQEYRAEKAMLELKKIIQPMSKVIRNAKLTEIPSREIVVGDVLVLDTGDRIPADAKILEITGLNVDESTLTGESMPVEKTDGEMLYAGTQIFHGHCKAFVTATGMKTKLGSIASMIQTEEQETPLQKNIAHLSKTLAGIALVACVLTLAVGIAKGAPIAEILLIALALTVAAVPEGLALTLTLTLAYGMKRMAEHHVIIRKMLAVETLGSTTVICSDKTGTLTKNEMTVEKIYINGELIDVTGKGYAPKGEFLVNGAKLQANEENELGVLLLAGALCNNSALEEKNSQWEVVGDPTEGALLVAAAKAELWKDDLELQYVRIQENVF
ncbi:MAG: HAD-IC family P-type ATPase, partial [Candidatus Micrarchaeota archaeon]